MSKAGAIHPIHPPLKPHFQKKKGGNAIAEPEGQKPQKKKKKKRLQFSAARLLNQPFH